MTDDARDPNAVALGRKGGKKGGIARAHALTAEQRSDASSHAATARWSVPAAIAQGTLKFGSMELPCYVLADERRVLSQRGLVTAMGMSGGGDVKTGDTRLVRFVESRGVGAFVAAELVEKITQPIAFRTDRGSSALGYEATILAELCEAVLTARQEGKLQKQQEHIAKQCEVLVRGFARVGIVALVDEATGYQYARDRRALYEILEAFIAKELAQWVKTFPDDYYRELFRLRKLRQYGDHKTPQYFGHLTNDIVYARMAPAILAELRQKNPKSGKSRKAHHHQWLTRETGHPKLMAHLSSVVTIMKLSDTWETFMRRMDRLHPRYNETLSLFADEGWATPPMEEYQS